MVVQEEDADDDSDWGLGKESCDEKDEVKPKARKQPTKAKFRHLAKEVSFAQNDTEVDDVFQSTPVKKKRKGARRSSGGSSAIEESLFRMDFLQQDVFDVEEEGKGRSHVGRQGEEEEERVVDTVSDQYLNRVINQVRPKHKGEAKALREHQQKSVWAGLERLRAPPPSEPVVKMKETVGGVTVEGKVRSGRVEVKVRREYDDEEEEEDWEFDEEDEEEANVITRVRV